MNFTILGFWFVYNIIIVLKHFAPNIAMAIL